MRHSLTRRWAPLFVGLLLGPTFLLGAAGIGRGQITLTADLTLDSAALLMPRASTYGRAINGVAFQAEALFTYNGYQYASWYHNGPSAVGTNEDFYVARRNLTGTTWQMFDTLKDLDNGDGTAPGSTWDAHNVISTGVSGDGRLHFSWDMHNNTFRYMNSVTGVATNPGAATWNATMLNAERSALNAGGSTIGDVTYPQFITKANGDMLMNYRTGSSGNGNVWLTTYRANTGLWDAPHQIIDGTATGVTYSDPYGTNSSDRNAYINGMNIDATGRIHTTWVWRETATGGSNHDMSYAYSDDGGDTWRNNAGAIVGTVGDPMTMDPQAANNVSGLIVVPMNRSYTLMNQQAQTVDEAGGVHMLMWHKTDAAPPQSNPAFTTAPAAYFHYVRNPTTGAWTRNNLPTNRAVGSRADMAYDGDGNLYVTYVSPGAGDGVGVLDYYTEGDLIVATASRAFGYQDWSIVSTDTRDWVGEPHIDQARLLESGVLSVIMQENDDANTGRTGTPLHVLEYDKLARNVVWAGNVAGVWSGTDVEWDGDNDNAGDRAFEAGDRAYFDDGAADFTVAVSGSVTPSATLFKNTAAQSYTVTGDPIGGSGGVTISGGGTVTFANGANTYTGATNLTAGRLNLTGTGALAGSTQINLATGTTLDASGAAAGLSLGAQTIAGTGEIVGFLTAQTGAVIRVGGAGMPTTPQATVIDDFADADLSQYTRTMINDGNAATQNINFFSPSGRILASYSGSPGAVEQSVFLRNDVGLGIGETLMVDVTMTATAAQMDFGLAVSATATPTAATVGDLDTRDMFNWASISARPSANEVRNNRSVGGVVTTTTDVVSAEETTVSNLYITRNTATQFTVGYTDTSAVKRDASVINFPAANVGTAVGFYADLRAAGALGLFDNLRIIENIPVGEELTIDGDVAMSSGATLAMDAYSPAIGDHLVVTGNFAAAGLLQVTLAAGAPAPGLGDAFDLFALETSSGQFDAYDLPALAGGLAWNISNLLPDGTMEVVADLDLDNDGWVDGDDLLIIQRTDASLIAAWQGQFGNRLVTPGGGSAPVPEPASAGLMALALCFAGLARRKCGPRVEKGLAVPGRWRIGAIQSKRLWVVDLS